MYVENSRVERLALSTKLSQTARCSFSARLSSKSSTECLRYALFGSVIGVKGVGGVARCLSKGEVGVTGIRLCPSSRMPVRLDTSGVVAAERIAGTMREACEYCSKLERGGFGLLTLTAIDCMVNERTESRARMPSCDATPKWI